jgi:LAS superfamily LD-carboxypeptidase LdcB
MNPYPVAPPGTSEHEIGQAVDVWAGSEENNALLGRTWVRWGGRWSTRDSVHFTL